MIASERDIATKTDPFVSIRAHNFINLTTFRKSGEAVTTPVWIALDGNRGYVVTDQASGKVKRIRNSPLVQVEPSTPTGKSLGPHVEAEARILAPEEWERPHQLLLRKYGWQYRFFQLLWRLRRVQHVYLEITPR